METEAVLFVCRMVFDEMFELLATIMPPHAAKSIVMNMVKVSRDLPQVDYTQEDDPVLAMVADQADALEDASYYLEDSACRAGINLDPVFEVVHPANMAKVDPETKVCKIIEGKIQKPKGWQPPDIKREMARQMFEGSWAV